MKLQEYYTSEGKADRVLIELPKGHYNPVFSLIKIRGHSTPQPEVTTVTSESPAQSVLPAVEESTPLQSREKRWIIVLATAVVLLIILAGALAVSNRNLQQQARERAVQSPIEKFGPVWEPFLKNSDETLLVLSNPAVYRFTNPQDPEAMLKDSVTLTPRHLKRINETLGDKFMVKYSPGQLILCTDEYTGMGEAIGLHRVTDLFRSIGRGVLLKQSRTVSAEDLKNHNVVLLGSVWVNEWSGKLPIKEDFTYTSNATIQNHNPQPGEERQYSPKFNGAGQLIEDYALITVKPNISDKNTVMVLAGIHSEGTEAAAEYATIPGYLNNLNQRLRQSSDASKPPRYYQALLKVAVDNGIPTTITLLSVHHLRGTSD
jgi:hypothetical protein